MTAVDWRDHAACQDIDNPEIFFPRPSETANEAKAITAAASRFLAVVSPFSQLSISYPISHRSHPTSTCEEASLAIHCGAQ